MASDEKMPEPSGETNDGPARPVEHLEQPSLVSRVKALAEALEGSDVSELDLTEDGARILIRRQLEATVIQPRGAARGRSGASRTGVERATPSGPLPEGVAIVAPLTGSFYTSPSPSAPQFAAIGETVQAGQVVCIIEAMKVFNEIKSEVAGTVIAIVAENGSLVHRGQALMRVKPI